MSFTRYKTKDGWEYGVGEYAKTVANYLDVRAPNDQTSITGKLAAFLVPAAAQQTYLYAKGITIPVFYIYATSPAGVKHIAEWPFAKSMRDAAFGQFAGAMETLPAAGKLSQLKVLQSSAGEPGLINLAKKVVREEQQLTYNEIRQQVTHAAGDAANKAASSTFIVLAAAAALGLFIVLS